MGSRVAITLFLLSPFLLSALILLGLDGGEAKNATEVLRRAARWVTAAGFVLIIGVLVSIFAAIELSRLPSS
jgi:hypothetical protein